MTEAAYRVSQAGQDLQASGLLAYALLRTEGVWQAADPAALPGVFAGAALDSRRVKAGELFIALSGSRTDGRSYVGEALSVATCALAGLPAGFGEQAGEPVLATAADPLTGTEAPDGRSVLVCREPRRALSELARRWRANSEAVTCAVTGSNGKTTTKDLLAALLTGAGPTLATVGNYNNDLGVPLTLLALRPEHHYAVVEMGASARGEIAALATLAAPRIGVITNAAEAHLAAFGSLAGVIAGKGELLDVLPEDGVAILNHDSPGFADWCRRARCRIVSFGRTAGEHRWQWQPTSAGGRLQLDDEHWEVPLPGPHNGGNLTAAILAARAAGATPEQMRAGLAGFRPSPHRSRLLHLGGRLLLDDSYNANPASMRSAAAALLALSGGPAIALLGTMAELGPRSDAIHRQTGGDLRDEGIATLVAVGEAAYPLADGFAAAGGRAHRCADAAAAAAWAERNTGPGDRILVKGSRSAAMDDVVALLEKRWGHAGASE